MKEYNLPYKSFIAGWFIDPTICNKLLKYFADNKASWKKGTYFEEDSKNKKETTNENVKQSTDLSILPDNLEEPLLSYRNSLQECLNKYLVKYQYANQVASFNINTVYNIQHYKPGGGFKIWHTESLDKVSSSRHLVFMTYLNTVKNGGTEFKYRDIRTEALKGLTLIWPTIFTHTHRSIISGTHPKYIITGWYTYS